MSDAHTRPGRPAGGMPVLAGKGDVEACLFWVDNALFAGVSRKVQGSVFILISPAFCIMLERSDASVFQSVERD